MNAQSLALPLLAAFLLAPHSSAAAPPPLALAAQDGVGKMELEEYQLEFDFTLLPGFEAPKEGIGEQVKARWTGKLGRSNVYMTLFVLNAKSFGLAEPSDVLDVVEENYARKDRQSGNKAVFAFDEKSTIPGKFGYASYGAWGRDTTYDGTRAVGDFYTVCGLLKDVGYALEVKTDPTLEDDDRKKLETFLSEGIVWNGEARDPNWTDEEVLERWNSNAPEKVLEDRDLLVVRTKYYLIMTDLKKGTARSFGKKMDEAYEKIRKVFPFEDVEGQRLLPIFYFVTDQEYFEWYAKNLNTTVERARRSGGVASGDVYATYHQATNAPVHIHEATHQIFRNRLHLAGGGSWYQEGLARYMDANPNDLSKFKSIAKKGNFTPFAEFFVIRSMLYSADANNVKGGNEAGDNYGQAATIVEFVRHSKFGKDKFLEWVHAVGAVPRSNLPAIEDAIRDVYGVSLDEFQDEYVKYWTKRKSPKKK